MYLYFMCIPQKDSDMFALTLLSEKLQLLNLICLCCDFFNGLVKHENTYIWRLLSLRWHRPKG